LVREVALSKNRSFGTINKAKKKNLNLTRGGEYPSHQKIITKALFEEKF